MSNFVSHLSGLIKFIVNSVPMKFDNTAFGIFTKELPERFINYFLSRIKSIRAVIDYIRYMARPRFDVQDFVE